MDPLLDIKDRTLLLGNEALVRGALEAGIGAFSTYPGTPASEIGDCLYRLADEAGLFFEYAVNEMVAVETVIAFSLSGYRSMAAMKHVGLNVASDAFMTFPYLGVEGGAVVVSADDPGCHSSQNEQDNRHLARMAGTPMLEPATPEELRVLTRRAFELSEQFRLPVLLRLTTRIAHMRAAVDPGPLPDRPVAAREFTRDPMNRVMVPSVARRRHREMTRMLEDAGSAANSPEFCRRDGPGSNLGIIATGSGRNLADSALRDLKAQGGADLLELAFTYPFPTRAIESFLQDHKRVLVVEELTPFMEDAVSAIAHRCHSDAEIFGKHTGHLTELGELGPDQVTAALADLTGSPLPAWSGADAVPSVDELPARPPILCPGCPHRASYLMTRQVVGPDTLVATDIGCYTLGLFPPLGMGDLQICMGGSVSLGAALGAALDRPVLAFIGDSTFFHAGIPGLVNAASNGRKLLLVVLDNETTAMTGYQPHPGSPGNGRRRIAIEKVAEACGADPVLTVDPGNPKKSMDAVRTGWSSDGVAVVVMRSPCARHALRTGAVAPRPPVRIVNGGKESCSNCTSCVSLTGCPALRLEKGSDGPEVIESLCNGCGLCAMVCPNGAIVSSE